ncbi:plastocyanin [Candidatus Nitrososphaera evergladensis SR1]|uniref:Plastocyanin n=1 Tax=Candidatus Nitrososphaera evergladensis SR1 TaxID=1459636 RepID=A0A075MWR3_9ARCH|nr:plastocyanin/azurin family copper-binding protein [Candidatus Nitrososphaera evergladensis]AIF85553.1 plastocyanin [Candidatus Nitrososphaera evergladensis SR1]
MTSPLRLTNTAGISLMAFIVAVVASLVYYEYFYIPEANKKPTAPTEVLNPPGFSSVTIVEGSSNPNQAQNYVPKQVRATLGIDNKIVWTNKDTTFHSVTTDTGYVDPINGKFDSIASIGLVGPEQKYEFTFTRAGEYPYHCEPHPWMTGKVTIVENFA